MDIKTIIPIGTKFKIKKTKKVVTLKEIRYYPTRYVTEDESKNIEYYRTFEVETVEEKSDN